MKVFISYSSKDVDQARRLSDQLKQDSVTVLRDQDIIAGGQAFDAVLEQALRQCDAVIYLVSADSRNSIWVKDEIVFAKTLRKTIIPLMLDTDLEQDLLTASLHHIDMYTDALWQSNYSHLTKALNSVAPISVPPPEDDIYGERAEAPPPTTMNPFIYGSRIQPEYFVGRTTAIQDIVGRLGGSQLQCISIVANRRMGKSSLLYYVFKEHARLLPQQYRWVPIYIDMMGAARTSKAVMFMLRVGLERGLPPDLKSCIWSKEDDGEMLYMAQTIADLDSAGVRLVLLLDEWESALAHPELTDWVETLRSAGQLSQVGIITSTAYELSKLHTVGGATSPFFNIFSTTYLGAMTPGEWMSLVTSAFARSGRPINPHDIDLIGELAGGQPYLTQLAGHLVWKASDERWNAADIRANFRREARPIFADLWNRQTVNNQKDTLFRLLGMNKGAPISDAAFADTIEQLQLRGVVTKSGDIFCAPFADFVRRELG